MKKIGLFYSFNTKTTKKVAQKIKEALGEDNVDEINVEELTADQFSAYDNMIVGSSTWFDGELPNYWDEFVPEIEDTDLSGKKAAIFGLGDQKNYPQNFADAIGILAELLSDSGAEIIGFTPADEFEYEYSRAEKDGQFMGLAIDTSNQAALTNERVVKWVEDLKTKLK